MEQELQNLQREAGEMLEKANDKIAEVGTILTTYVTVRCHQYCRCENHC